jgi:hypothetical protein
MYLITDKSSRAKRNVTIAIQRRSLGRFQFAQSVAHQASPFIASSGPRAIFFRECQSIVSVTVPTTDCALENCLEQANLMQKNSIIQAILRMVHKATPFYIIPIGPVG